jgi:hypothetical protein
LSFQEISIQEQKLYKEVPNVSKVGYLPVIDAPVTDMASINTILYHSISICQRLQLPEIVLVFDEAIYCKAQGPVVSKAFNLDGM